jgi:hypothetical protein
VDDAAPVESEEGSEKESPDASADADDEDADASEDDAEATPVAAAATDTTSDEDEAGEAEQDAEQDAETDAKADEAEGAPDATAPADGDEASASESEDATPAEARAGEDETPDPEADGATPAAPVEAAAQAAAPEDAEATPEPESGEAGKAQDTASSEESEDVEPAEPAEIKASGADSTKATEKAPEKDEPDPDAKVTDPGTGTNGRPVKARAPVPAPGDAETTMVGPRVPRSEDVTRTVRRPPAPPPRTLGPPTPTRWTPPGGAPAHGWRPPPQRPAAPAPGGPNATGQRLAADPGPLPFTPSARPAPPARRSPWAVAAVVALLVVMAALGAIGAYALTRSLAGQAPLSTELLPAGPEVAGTVLVAHADTDQRYAGTGLDFSALVPSGWQQFRLEQPGGDVTVRFVSPDANRELRIDRVAGFYPSQRTADYIALLSRPDSLGVDGSSVGPVETVGTATPGGEPPVQTVYRTTSGPADDRTTWTRLVPSGTSLWVIRMTAASSDVVGVPDQFRAVADSFAAPPP